MDPPPATSVFLFPAATETSREGVELINVRMMKRKLRLQEQDVEKCGDNCL